MLFAWHADFRAVAKQRSGPPSPAPPEPSAEKLPSECWEEGPGSGSLSRSEDAPPREEALPGDGCAAGRRLRRLVASQIRRARGGGELIVIVTGRRATVVLRRGLRPAVIRQRDAQRRKEVRASRQLVELCVVESHPVGATVALELVDRDGTLRRARYERPELAHEHSRGHRARHSSPPARLLEVRRPDERLLLGGGRRVNLGGRRAFVHQPRVVEGLWWTYRIGLRA